VSLAPQLGYVLIAVTAMWALALAIGLLTWSGWRARSWPRWLRWLSVTTTGLLPLSGFAFMPIIMLPIWVLGASIWAWRSTPTAPEHATR
jgi:hypothetical protein